MIEILSQWHFEWVCILAGAIGGFIKAIASAEYFALPLFSERKIFFASLKSVLVGAFIGFVVDTHPVFSALMGYSGMDVLETLERKLHKRLETATKDGDESA